MSCSASPEMGHHTCCNQQKVKRGLWSPEEDEKLIRHIATHGYGCWSEVPEKAGPQLNSPIRIPDSIESVCLSSVFVHVCIRLFLCYYHLKMFVLICRATEVREELSIEVDKLS